MSDHDGNNAGALRGIRNLDYVVVFVRDMAAMQAFYHDVMGFPLYRELFDGNWVEYRVGASLLTLTRPGKRFDIQLPAPGVAALQFAFRVEPGGVDACADALRAAGVPIALEPTDQPWGHRTLFFRDPDGNIVEIYADIWPTANPPRQGDPVS